MPLDATAVDAEAARVHAVGRNHVDLDQGKLESITSVPFAAGVEDSEGTQQLISSCKLVLGDILVRCDDAPQENLDSTRWVPR